MNTDDHDDSWADILAALVDDHQDFAISDEDAQLSRDILKAQYNSLLEYQIDQGQRQESPANSSEIGPSAHTANQLSSAPAQSLSSPLEASSLRYMSLLDSRRPRGPRDGWERSMSSIDSADRQLRQIQPSGLCFACSNIVIENQYPSSHHKSFNLSSTATQGCLMCKFILRNFKGETSNRSAEVTVDLKFSLLRYRAPNDAGGSQAVFELFSRTVSRDPGVNFRNVPSDPMSAEALELIRAWLSNCHSNHEFCTRDTEFSLPTRVIDVTGPTPCIREIQLFNTPYITLSHCWGDTPTLMSLKSTLPEYMKGITTSNLPRTFQDAVTVTKKLGISYLWIDSLCIIQDSIEDWIAECPKMRAYYRNSYVTLSAFDSPNSQHGFLDSRDTSDEVLVPNETDIWIRPRLMDRGKLFQKAPLNHRGWALQERLLSTCVLHFTRQEMFWECQTSSTQESSITEHRGPTDFQLLVSSEGDDFKRVLTSIGPDRFSPQTGAFALWMRLIRQFSRRSLTFPSDKLPAISGLAAIMAAKTRSKYMAGLWEDDLQGLAWFRDGPDDRISHAKGKDEQAGYLAPSWSWVRMNESITYRFHEEERVTSSKDPILLNSDIQTRDSDPFGCVSGGCITIQALTKPVQCLDHLKAHKEYIFGWTYPKHWSSYHREEPFGVAIYGEDGSYVGAACFDSNLEKRIVHQCKAVRVVERRYMREAFWMDDAEEGGREHWDGNRGPIKQSVVYFLLLQPDQETDGAWKRVGAGMTRNFSMRQHYPDFFDLWDWEELRLV